MPNVHLYPSFEEIENYIYPNVGDVSRLLKIGHTYETIFHGYFNHSSCAHSPELHRIPNRNIACDENEHIQLEYQEYHEYQESQESQVPQESQIETYYEEETDPKESSDESFIVESPPPPAQSPPPPNAKRAPPPGFENIEPNVENFTQTTIQAVPAVIQHPLNPFNSNADVAQFMNQSSILNLAIVNPFVFNQMVLQREILLQQQREALLHQQRTALFQHQFEQFQRIISKNSPSGSGNLQT